MIKTRKKGARRERQVKKYLEGEGFKCVKSGASLGLFDLICFDRNSVVFIQVKSNYCSPKIRKEIQEFEVNPALRVLKQIWVFKKGGEIKIEEY